MCILEQNSNLPGTSEASASRFMVLNFIRGEELQELCELVLKLRAENEKLGQERAQSIK